MVRDVQAHALDRAILPRVKSSANWYKDPEPCSVALGIKHIIPVCPVARPACAFRVLAVAAGR